MTPQPIDFDKVRPGDRIRYSLTRVVDCVAGNEIFFRSEGRQRTITANFGWDIELVDRPLPPEPPEGSVVIFRQPGDVDQVSRVQAYKRWGWGRWLHAGNSTPADAGRSMGRGQGYTWARLLEMVADDAEMTVIEP